MPTAEATRCVCGLGMADNGRGGFYCPNCDVVQPQEPHGLERRKTSEDIRFDMYWLRVINKEYVDNTQPNANEAKDETTGGNNE